MVILIAYLLVLLEEGKTREGTLAEAAGERDGEGRVGGQGCVGIPPVGHDSSYVSVRRRHDGVYFLR